MRGHGHIHSRKTKPENSTLRTPEKTGLQRNADHEGMNKKWRKSGNLSPFQKTQMTFDCPILVELSLNNRGGGGAESQIGLHSADPKARVSRAVWEAVEKAPLEFPRQL